MQSIKDIKSRIKSVTETAQITRAMELISASKMQKSSLRYNNSLAYFNRVQRSIYDILRHTDFQEIHPSLDKEGQGKHAFIVIGSDKGMSGDYNHAILNFASSVLDVETDAIVFCIGATVYQHFHEVLPDVRLVELKFDGSLEDARILAADFMERFNSVEINKIDIIYMSLVSKTRQQPAKIQLLPISKEDFLFEKQEGYDYRLDFLPDAESVFEILVPQYLVGMLYGCITAGKYTEHLERMRAMNAATKNATELLDELHINYNKARQEKITTELIELSSSLPNTD